MASTDYARRQLAKERRELPAAQGSLEGAKAVLDALLSIDRSGLTGSAADVVLSEIQRASRLVAEYTADVTERRRIIADLAR